MVRCLPSPAPPPAPARPTDHGFQAGDLVFCLVQKLLPVPLLLEQQLGPSAEGTPHGDPVAGMPVGGLAGRGLASWAYPPAGSRTTGE